MLFVLCYNPNINKFRWIGDSSSVLIMQSYNSDLSEATIMDLCFFVGELVCRLFAYWRS